MELGITRSSDHESPPTEGNSLPPAPQEQSSTQENWPLKMSQSQISMLEIAKNLLLCKHEVDHNDQHGDFKFRAESTEKLKFKLISLQLVNQIFCRKLRRKQEDIERLTSVEEDEESQETSTKEEESLPEVTFSNVYEGDCLKSKVAIKFNTERLTEKQDLPHESVDTNEVTERKFVVREGPRVRSRSLMNYTRKFSTKNLKLSSRRHHSVKSRAKRDETKPLSCPDLHKDDKTCGGYMPRLASFDSVDDFTSQLFDDHIFQSSREDLLSICFE